MTPRFLIFVPRKQSTTKREQVDMAGMQIFNSWTNNPDFNYPSPE
jgi:hypothetical protein